MDNSFCVFDTRKLYLPENWKSESELRALWVVNPDNKTRAIDLICFIFRDNKAPYLQPTMLHNRGQKSQIKSKKRTTWEGTLHLTNGSTEKGGKIHIYYIDERWKYYYIDKRWKYVNLWIQKDTQYVDYIDEKEIAFSVKIQCWLLSAEWLLKFADEAEKEALKVKTIREQTLQGAEQTLKRTEGKLKAKKRTVSKS